MKNKYKERLAQTVANSNLSYSQKELWQLFIKISKQQEDEAVYKSIINNRNNLEILTDYFQEQIWKIKRNDKEMWKKIVKSEKELAKSLNYNVN